VGLLFPEHILLSSEVSSGVGLPRFDGQG
jgi:hypothetical protein